MTQPASHGAAGAALGYLYQTKLALLELLRADGSVPGAGLSLELFDDVAWEAEGQPLELIQAKHTLRGGRALTDAAAPWWSAIAVWLDAGPVADPDAPRLVLVTNARTPPGSALHSLRPGTRDEPEADRLLLEAASADGAAGTAGTRGRVAALTAADRKALIGRITVLDGAPDVTGVDEEVARLLRLVTPPGRERPFLDQIWGRWWDVAVRLLRREIRTVTSEQWIAVVNAVRDEFTAGRLTTTVAEPGEAARAGLEADMGQRTFVHQLRWVGAPNAILRRCIIDYYRSAQQQHAWVEDSLVALHELDGFHDRLKQEWELAFAFETARLPPDADEEQRASAGRALLEAMLGQTRVWLRDSYQEPFLGRGVLHELADREDVGWHPDFEDRLRGLLLEAS